MMFYSSFTPIRLKEMYFSSIEKKKEINSIIIGPNSGFDFHDLSYA